MEDFRSGLNAANEDNNVNVNEAFRNKYIDSCYNVSGNDKYEI